MNNIENMSTLYVTKRDNVLYKNISIDYKYLVIKLNSESLVSLYIIVGLSDKSFTNNYNILNENIDKIKDKYNMIIFFRMDASDIQKEYINQIKLQNPNLSDYTINGMLQNKMAIHINKIIFNINRKLPINEIDLLGVSFGGGICIMISRLNDIKIRKLILVAPGIAEGLCGIPNTQYVILNWCIQDKKIDFNTIGIKCINDLKPHNNNLILLTDLQQPGVEVTDEMTHRLQPGLFYIL